MYFQTSLTAALIFMGQQQVHGHQQEAHAGTVSSSIEQRIEAARNGIIDLTRRATLDVGSGATKILVADVDRITNQITKIWHRNSKIVALRQDLHANQDERLSQEIENKLIQTIQEIQNDVKDLQPQEWAAVGTSVFRTAKNGEEFLKRVEEKTKIKIRLIPQSEEGEIGFITAVAACGKTRENVIAWDSGIGSFQMSASIDGEMTMYGSEFGFQSALELLFALRGKPATASISPNPVNPDEIPGFIESLKEHLPPPPVWITNHQREVITFGDMGCIFSMGMIATGHSSFSKEEIMLAISRLANSTDAQLNMFPSPHKTMVGLCLLYAVMDHCKISETTFYQTNGSCEGMLIMPRFWE